MGEKRVICLLVVISVLLLSLQAVPRVEGGQEEGVRVFADLDIVGPNSSVPSCQFSGFNDDGSFYYIVWSDTFEGGYSRLMLISPYLDIVWNKSFSTILSWAIAPDGAIALLAGHPDYGTMYVYVIEETGNERWSTSAGSNYYYSVSMAFTANGSVLIGSKDYYQENSTTITGFDVNGDNMGLSLPMELRNTTVPVVLKNGTLTAQDEEWIYGLSSDLKVTWKIPLLRPSMGYPYRFIAEDRVILCIDNLTWIDNNLTNDGGVYCYDLEGNLIWRYPSGNTSKWFYFPSINGPEDKIFLLTQDSSHYPSDFNITTLWPNGTLCWDYPMKSSGYQLSLPVLYKDGSVAWNGSALFAINGDGRLSWSVDLILDQEYYMPNVYVGPTDYVYITYGDNIKAIGDYHEPEKPQDWSIYLIVPLLIAILVLAVYIKGKGMKDDDD